jgi:hypothetical protein
VPKSTKDIPLETTNLFLFVGPADGGKSYAATSFGYKSKDFGGDDDRPCYMLELDGRINALRGRPIVYDEFTNVEGAIGVLNRVIELRDTCVKFNRAPFHTLILDSFSSYNDFSIADSLNITIEKNEGKKEADKKGRRRGELQLMTIEDYGYETEAWRQLMYENFIDIKRYANVILIAHEVESYRTVKGAPGEPTQNIQDGYKILAHGNKIAARIPTKFDEIYHFPKKEVVISTKTIRRSVIFQDEIARSSYPQLIKLTTPIDISCPPCKEFYPLWKDLISKPTVTK